MILHSFRASFLYSKMYFFFHSCLSALGMKNLCPDFEFDGVYFQKMYSLNIREEKIETGEEKNPENGDGDQEKLVQAEVFSLTDIINEFAAIIQM